MEENSLWQGILCYRSSATQHHMTQSLQSVSMHYIRFELALISLTCVMGIAAPRLSAQDSKQLGDYTLKYGYAYYTASGRSVENGGVGAVQKLPGEFKFWFNNQVDMFVRSDTVKASHNTNSWTAGAGDTVVGLDMVLRSEGNRAPEFDFTYDAKLPTSLGFRAGEVDHEAILSLLKGVGRHSFEADLGDYIEGFAHSAAAHSFELTLSDEIGLRKCRPGQCKTTYRWTTIHEFDFTSSSPDTASEAYQLAKLKYYVSDRFAIAPGVRVTYTPYSGRFAAFVTFYCSGGLRRH